MKYTTIPWLGGKKRLAKQIISMFPEHDTYVEVFGGSGAVLFEKCPDGYEFETFTLGRRYLEVYNDINNSLTTFWRYVKYHPEALAAEMNTYPVSREVWKSIMESKPRTELEKAAHFYYALVCSYGAKRDCFSIRRYRQYMPLRDIESMLDTSGRLKHVIIENLDWQELIERYDDEGTLFYLDPPYYEKEGYYEKKDSARFEDHDKMAERLKDIKGKFVVSYNDVEHIRELYAGFNIEAIDAPYRMREFTIGKELLIYNY